MCIIETVGSRSRGGSVFWALTLATAASTATAVFVRRKFYDRHSRECPPEEPTSQEDHEHDHGDEVSELSAPFLSEENMAPAKDLPTLPEDTVQQFPMAAVDVLPGMLNFQEDKHNVAEHSDETEQTFCSVFTFTETLEVWI